MQTVSHDNPFAGTRAASHAGSGRTAWIGRILSGVAVAFLIFDSVGKLLQVQPVIDGTRELGYPVDVVFGLGVTLASCVLVYLIPRTSVLGAVLLTGYLGGAVATHVRVGNPLLTHTLFPIYVAAFIWGGLVLRDVRLRVFLPWRTQS
jgi:DoxX-like family